MQDVNLLSADSHMHKYATNFVATTSTGVTLFSTTQWAEPPAKVFSPALALTAGTSITWTCTDVNATGQELTFGESAVTNVMCIYTSIFYPVSDVTNPVLGSLVGFAGL
jgi:plastocyanin